VKLHRLLRNRAIGITKRALAPAAAWRASREPATVTLATVGRRLELLLAAMYGRRMSVGVAPSSSPPASPANRADVALPAVLDAHDGQSRAIARYRLLAIEQGARLVRGTHADLPSMDPLERDLYTLAEGATIDRAIVRQAPGLAEELRSLRRTELTRRFALDRSPPAERDVEALLQSILDADPGAESDAIPDMASPAESAAWARDEAGRIRAGSPVAAHYRGIPAIDLWSLGSPAPGVEFATPLTKLALQRTAVDQPSPTGDANAPERGQQGDAPGAEGEDATTGAPDAAGDEQPGGEIGAATQAREASPMPGGILYREWDEYAGRYRPDEVTVHARVAPGMDDTWATDVLRTYAPLVRQIRGRFAPLRAHRTRLRAQRAGDELDLDACVAALVDLRRGHLPDDRLYRVTRPARRTLAIMLLVDVSGSTNAFMADGRTVLEVERMTLLLASEALDELGDPYAVLAFSSSGRHDVRVDAVKTFADHDAAGVRRRISALTSARNTRLGAALRHATAMLNAQPAERRLLLLLSDGQPNDIFGYQGSYAVGDSRRAVLEARASGVHPFCLTVDREEQEYLPHLFGANGYRVLRDPGQLPAVLLQVVTQLLPG
jgi:nitric oxide reductase NorD protein